MINYGLRRSFFIKEICPVCKKDLARRYVLHPFVLPYPYGKGQWLTLDCACTKKERSKERLERNKILISQKEHPLPPGLRTHTFVNFKVGAYNQTAYDSCLTYVSTFGRLRSRGLVLHGETGVGKTHLAAAVGNVLKEKHSVTFAYVPELLDKMRNTHMSLEPLLNADLLILDDIGSERPTDWTAERLLIIVDGRLNRFKSTVFTSNFEPEDFEKRLGERIASRILGNNLKLEVNGPDWRQIKARMR